MRVHGATSIRPARWLPALIAAALLGVLAVAPAALASIIVNTTDDGGPGSLRAALLQAAATPNSVINFNLSGNGPFTITPSTPLPALTEPTTIDGTTQSGYAGTPLIVINGSGLSMTGNGLDLAASGITVNALGFVDFPQFGIQDTAGGNTIENSYIGVDTAGAPAANGGGVFVSNVAHDDINKNVISSNKGDGITIGGSGAQGNIIEGNLIGLLPDGMTPRPNGGAGIDYLTGATHTSVDLNSIYGPTAIANNGQPNFAFNNDVVRGDITGAPAGPAVLTITNSTISGNASGPPNTDALVEAYWWGDMNTSGGKRLGDSSVHIGPSGTGSFTLMNVTVPSSGFLWMLGTTEAGGTGGWGPAFMIPMGGNGGNGGGGGNGGNGGNGGTILPLQNRIRFTKASSVGRHALRLLGTLATRNPNPPQYTLSGGKLRFILPRGANGLSASDLLFAGSFQNGAGTLGTLAPGAEADGTFAFTEPLPLSLVPGTDFKFQVGFGTDPAPPWPPSTTFADFPISDPLATFGPKSQSGDEGAPRVTTRRTRFHGLAGAFSIPLPAGANNDLAPGVPDPNQVVRVDVALVKSSPARRSGHGRAGGTNCLYLTGRGHYRSGHGGSHGCVALSWVPAHIQPFSDNWYYGFDPAHPLPAGTWTGFVRAITRAGIGDPSIRDQYKNSPYRHVFVCRPHHC